MGSLLTQTFSDFEVIIVDDGSADGTKRFLSELLVSDGRFRCIEKKSGNPGACASRNLAIENARGEFITGLDDDDWFHPLRLAYFYSQWKGNYSCLGTNSYHVIGGAIMRSSFVSRKLHFEDLLYRNSLGSQVFTLTKRLQSIGGFDEDLSASQDYDLWLRLTQVYGPALRLRPPYYFLDVSDDRPRISNTAERNIGTEQFIAKYQGIMSCRQLKKRQLHNTRSVRRSNFHKVRDVISLGPRYAYEAARSRLRIG